MRRTSVGDVLRGEVGLARVAVGVVALHVLDDRFLQPSPGTSAGDHLLGGLVPTALLVAGAILYGRVRAGARATIALASGFFGVLAATEAVYYTKEVGPSGDDYTGLLSLLAGLLLLGLGGVTLWRSRKTDGPRWRRYGRRAVILAGVVVVADVILFPVALSYVITHVAPGGRAEGEPRGARRAGRAHDDRRVAPARVVRPFQEPCRGDLLPGPDLHAGRPAARRPARHRPEDLRHHLLRLRRERPARRAARERGVLRRGARHERALGGSGSGHTTGIEAQPAEYERRVVGFFDRTLLRRD